jgi:hypothetical protein
MSFVLDQQTVFDEFDSVITEEISDQLRAHVAGPHGGLHRYSVADEKAEIGVGAYDETQDTTYDWPAKAADSLVDLDYVKVFVDNALLHYFTKSVGSGGTLESVDESPNRIRITTDGFKEADGYPRRAALKDRDVAVGDVVKVWESDEEESFWTYVADVIADVVDAEVGTATNDDDNVATQASSSSGSQTAGGENYIEIGSIGGTYDGLEDGDITETYTIEVTTGGLPAAARLSVASASGRDDATDVTPADFDSPTTIGSRGLTVTFHLDSGNPLDPGDIETSEFVVGQTWEVTVNQAFTRPTLASGGTYTGTELNEEVTYVVRVTKGGSIGASGAEVTVTRNDGVDASGPTGVTASGSPVVIGSLGVTLTFTGTKLRYGDVYYVPVTTEADGAYRTLLLGSNMPNTLAVAADLNLKLFLSKDLQLTEISDDDVRQWAADQDGVVLQDGIVAGDATFTDGGDPFTVPVVSGEDTVVYVEYREWLTAYVESVTPVVPASDTPEAALAAVEALLGTAHPDNVLCWGVYKALLNSNGTGVYFSAVADPDDQEAWEAVPPMLEGMKDLLSLAPLTEDPAVHAVWAAHCDARSVDSVGGEWRSCWLPLVSEPVVAVVNEETAGSPTLATLTANVLEDGEPITLLTCTSGNGDFVTNGVAAGDVVRFLYETDGFGRVTYTSFVVDSVVNEDSLLLTEAHSVPITLAARFEVWRNQTRAQAADRMAAVITDVSSKRVRYVWPDVVGDSGTTYPGYHLCAALAGFVSGIAPHQSIRNVSISGFDDVSSSNLVFNNAQLNQLAAAGCVIVRQDTDGNVYASYSRTTDQSSVDNGEEMVVRNDDAFSHFIYRRCQSFFGQTNVTDTGMATILAAVTAAISTAKGATQIDRIGSMITDGKVTTLEVDEDQPDRVIVVVTRTRPYPANEATITLVM